MKKKSFWASISSLFVPSIAYASSGWFSSLLFIVLAVVITIVAPYVIPMVAPELAVAGGSVLGTTVGAGGVITGATAFGFVPFTGAAALIESAVFSSLVTNFVSCAAGTSCSGGGNAGYTPTGGAPPGAYVVDQNCNTSGCTCYGPYNSCNKAYQGTLSPTSTNLDEDGNSRVRYDEDGNIIKRYTEDGTLIDDAVGYNCLDANGTNLSNVAAPPESSCPAPETPAPAITATATLEAPITTTRPPVITYEGCTRTINWSVQDGTSCTGTDNYDSQANETGWLGERPSPGSKDILFNLNKSGDFTFSCSYNSASDSSGVTVCPTDQYIANGKCNTCQNGGCISSGLSCTDPVCSNGAINIGECNICPIGYTFTENAGTCERQITLEEPVALLILPDTFNIKAKESVTINYITRYSSKWETECRILDNVGNYLGTNPDSTSPSNWWLVGATSSSKLLIDAYIPDTNGSYGYNMQCRSKTENTNGAGRVFTINVSSPPPTTCPVGQTGTPPNCSCPVNTSWNGTACVPITAKDCTLPWGGKITNTTSITAYQSSSVNAPATCISQSRTCNNGILSGSYINQNCIVTPRPTACPVGQTGTPPNCSCPVNTSWNGTACVPITVNDRPPTSPIITGPTTGSTYTTYTFAFSSTDPDGDPIRYGIDWDMDGTADQWLPLGITYVNSGITLSANNNWLSTGIKKFQALTQDSSGNNSNWKIHTITIDKIAPPCPAGTVWNINLSLCTFPQCTATNNCLQSNTGVIVDGICSVNAPPNPLSYTLFGTCSGGEIVCPLGTLWDDTACVPISGACGSPWNGVVANGGSITTYLASSVNPPATCISETRSCNNGTLSGSYTNRSCRAGNKLPTSPIITGPTTGSTYTTYTFNFNSTDSDGDPIRYGVDWNMDGTADQWLPLGVTYVNSGTTLSAKNSWLSLGTKRFQVIAQDFMGANSDWRTHTITLSTNGCPLGYILQNGTCVNPQPELNIVPTGTNYIPKNVPYAFASLATDESNDITTHNIEWKTPNGKFNWDPTNSAWGSVSYKVGPVYTNGTDSSDNIATFTPDHVGLYQIRFAAQDNVLSNYDPDIPSPRWSYSLWTAINVVEPVLSEIKINPLNNTKLTWKCTNANRATLVTTNGPTINDFSNKTLPPYSGSIDKSTGATYILTCKNTQTNQTVTTTYIATTGDTPMFTISSYIRGNSFGALNYSSTVPSLAISPDGQYYDWSYRIENGPASACFMSQRNDTGEWYPYPAYGSDPTTYTSLWRNLTPFEQSSFISSYTTSHDWKLVCNDVQGRIKTLTWSIRKSGTTPIVIEASLNLDGTKIAPTPNISILCGNSDYYEVKNSLGNIIPNGNGPITGKVVVSLNGLVTDTYSIICKMGGATGVPSREILRTYSPTLYTTQVLSLVANPRTINKGNVSTISWTIARPTNSCTLRAESVCNARTSGSSGSCNSLREANAQVANDIIRNSATDENDPYNTSGVTRPITSAIQEPAENSDGKALGRKTLKLDYSTDFIMNCGSDAGQLQKVRVQVASDNEG